MKEKTAWSYYCLAWGVVFASSQILDKSPLNKTWYGEAFEETLEATAQVMVLVAITSFILMLRKRAVK